MISKFLLAGLFFAVSCSNPQSEAGAAENATAGQSAPSLEKLWSTEGFSQPEGVAAAPGGGFYISNIAGDAATKDGNGWITHLSESGEILKERFIDGLDAPKGLAVLNNVLYVSDIDRVRRFSLPDGAPLSETSIEGAKFLNDATAWQDAVYVSDSSMKRIHRITEDDVALWLESEDFGGVNGLLGDDDRILIATDGVFFEADRQAHLKTIAEGVPSGDGIGLTPNGDYLISSWPGEVYFVSKAGSVENLLDTRDQNILQNDLSVFGDLVIIPNYNPGTVTAWRISHP